MEMLHISKADFDRIGADYKGVYMDYQGMHPQRKGRRVAFLPGHGTTLYTEGIHFVIDDDCTHLPILCKENAEEGAAYQFGGGILYVNRLYRISAEYARENHLAYLERVETSTGDFALPGGDTINAARAWPARREKWRKSMKTFSINGVEYTVEPCTAICGADMGDESRRQDALFVSSENGGERSEFVVFGWEMPETADGFSDMCDDPSAWESDQDVVDTVKK